MTKEVEDIIRNKAYYELSNGERESVAEYAQNEEEYNNMQWFLTGTTAAFGAAKVEASPGLKKGVMEHLTEAKKKKGFWLNSVGVFMLPTNKKFYQKPAFQLGIAAAAVVGLLFALNPSVDDPGLAVVDTLNKNQIELEERNESPVEEELESDLDWVPDSAVLSDELAEDLPAEPEEILEFELGEMNETKELTIVDQATYSASTRVENNGDVVTFAAPMIEEVEVMMDDEELDMSFDQSTIEDDLDEIAITESVSTQKDNNAVADASEKEEERDRVKISNFRKAKKQDAELDNKFVDAEPAAEGNDGSVAPGTASGGSIATNEEWIKPKAMHINKTKELNALFFIEK
jgi:hypothetical protein